MSKPARPRVAAGVLLLAAAGLIVTAQAAAASRTSVLILSIDTLRADHLGLYGYGRATDPDLAQAAADFTLFTAAYTPIPLTFPAHAALLTGSHPRDLGLLNNRHALPADAPGGLAVWLAAAGYQTAAVVGSQVLDGAATGLDRGFGAYLGPAADSPSGRLDAAEVNARAADILESSQGPLFLLVHYYDPHEPYRVPDRLACAMRADLALDSELELRGVAGLDYEKLLNRQRADPVVEQGRRLTVREMTARYDAAVRYATDRAADLLRLWESSRHGPGSLIIVTADHGEGLGQHGFWSHGMDLYDEALRIPMLVRWPAGRQPGLRREAPVSLLDVAPTVLAAAGLPQPEPLQGVDLDPLLPATPGTRMLVAERMRYLPHERPPGLRHWRPGDGFAILEGPWKYIQEPEAAPALFHRGDDPGETRNLWRRGRLPGEELRRRLDVWLEEHPDQAVWPPRAVDPERQRLLRSLGYVDR